jgi:hypothetical protein
MRLHEYQIGRSRVIKKCRIADALEQKLTDSGFAANHGKTSSLSFLSYRLGSKSPPWLQPRAASAIHLSRACVLPATPPLK